MATLVSAIFVALFATEFQVGPGQAYTTIGAVPWYTLAAGDIVYIHYATYHEKFLVSTQGTAQNPIKIIGVPDSNGNLPIIDGQDATTSKNNHHKWQTPTDMQWSGVVFIGINGDAQTVPQYIEIHNLEIKNGYKDYNFTAENDTTLAYEDFAAGIYLRVKHALIENCIIHDNGQALYNWAGDGSAGGDTWWDVVPEDITLRGNYFYNNGVPGSYSEHQTYTESNGVTIEYNHYGQMRSGELGSQLKDRSAGTIIRYNYFDAAPAGWIMDLVEPQNGWPALGGLDTFKQTFVYGNIIINNGNYSPDYFHWNEDQYSGEGRATVAGGKLLFYENTILTIANKTDMSSFHYFNIEWGGYDCPSGSLPGIVDIRNNIFAVLPRTPGQAIPEQHFAYCNNQNFDFGVNWVSPGWITNTSGTVTGSGNLYSPSANNPGFVSPTAPFDLHLTSGSDALTKGGASAPEMTNNYLNQNLTPLFQYVTKQSIEARSGLTSLGAYEFNTHPQAILAPDGKPCSSAPVPLFSNPCRGRFSVELTLDKPQYTTVKMLNCKGQTVFSEAWSAGSGISRHSFLVSSLPAGIYMIVTEIGNKHYGRTLLLTRETKRV